MRKSSQYRGVHWRSDARKWRAYATVNGVPTSLGYFADEMDAACAYGTALGLDGPVLKVKQGYIDETGVGHIPLTKDRWALCDAHWFHYLSKFNWTAKRNKSGRWYAVRSSYAPNQKRVYVYMARVVMGVTDEEVEVDHKNRDATLDNRKSNLRIATSSQNNCNVGVTNRNTSGFKGVHWNKDRNKWRATIGINNKRHSLGYFETREAAAHAYNEAAKQVHGDFAALNPLQHELGDQAA